MDLNTIETVLRPQSRGELPAWREGDACLAGGTWLFSEPQPGTRRLVDLTGLGWQPHAIGPEGLILAATCTLAQLDRLELPPTWSAATLIGECCRALLGSFKIWNTATIGGNLCLALPAGPMIALAVALDARCVIWSADGTERDLPATDFVLGPQCNALRAGEILRSVRFPSTALTRRSAFRRISLSPAGRSGALLIGTLDMNGAVALTVTAAIRRPVRIAFDTLPDDATLSESLAVAIPDALYHDDVHGRPDWRRHVTSLLAREIRDVLQEGRPCDS